MMQLGRFIREYRLERGMTQLELARKLKNNQCVA